MAAQSAGDRSKFLALPAELRARIYELLFEDENDKDLNAFLLKSFLPARAITRVSHEIRRETIELFNQATEAFWRNQIFYIQPSNANDLSDGPEPNNQVDCDHIPKTTGIPKLTFRLVGLRLGPVPFDNEFVNCDVEFDVDPYGAFKPRDEAVPFFLPRLISLLEDGSTAAERRRHRFVKVLAWHLAIPALRAYRKINDGDLAPLNLRRCIKALVEVRVRGNKAGLPYE